MIELPRQIAVYVVVIAISMLYSTAQAKAPIIDNQDNGALVVAVQNTNSNKDALDYWLDKLQMAESGTDPQVIIMDTNNQLSKGCIQFQQATWNAYSKVFNFKGSIMSCNDQRQLARYILLEDKNQWRNWRCSVKGGADPLCAKLGITKDGIGLPPL